MFRRHPFSDIRDHSQAGAAAGVTSAPGPGHPGPLKIDGARDPLNGASGWRLLGRPAE